MFDPLEGIAPDGTIVTGVDRSRVPPVFAPVLAAFVDALPVDVAAYVYGSVATGQARPGHSDVDLLTVGLDPRAAAELGAALSHHFAPLCRGVEISVGVRVDSADEGDQAYGDRAFLRHYCAHLRGPDQARGWPAFAADARVARGFNGDVARRATRWRSDLRDGAEPADLGRRLARKTLLTLAGLVSVHDGGWTTDRHTAVARWSEVRPDLAGDLRTLLAWSEGTDVPDAIAVADALDGPVASIVVAFTETVGLWQ